MTGSLPFFSWPAAWLLDSTRTEASIAAALLQTPMTKSRVENVGGPVCRLMGERADSWWQIRMPDSKEGWWAEAQLNTPSHFLEPIP
jgi:hypothetical protein